MNEVFESERLIIQFLHTQQIINTKKLNTAQAQWSIQVRSQYKDFMLAF